MEIEGALGRGGGGAGAFHGDVESEGVRPVVGGVGMQPLGFTSPQLQVHFILL